MPRHAQPLPRPSAGRRLTDEELIRLISGEFVYRRCAVCEWDGLLAESLRTEPDCPMCHAPTEVVAFLQPVPNAVPLWKNPHAAALGKLGGRRGGPARAAKLSSKRRTEIARKAALARWKK